MTKKLTTNQLKDALSFLSMRSLTLAVDKNDECHKQRTLEYDTVLQAAIDELNDHRQAEWDRERKAVDLSAVPDIFHKFFIAAAREWGAKRVRGGRFDLDSEFAIAFSWVDKEEIAHKTAFHISPRRITEEKTIQSTIQDIDAQLKAKGYF